MLTKDRKKAPGGARKVPDCATLKRLIQKGLTQEQIAEWTLEHTGNEVTRSAVGQAMIRCGLKSAKPRARYVQEIPWTLPDSLQTHPWVRILRLWARENAGKPITDEEKRRLDTWKAEMDRLDASIHYDPEYTPPQLFRVPRRPGETYVRQPDE